MNRKIIISNRDLDWFICCSLRYAYARHTGMPDFVRSKIRQFTWALTDCQLKRIIDDIDSEQRWNATWRGKTGGMSEIEINEWMKLKGELTCELVKRASGKGLEEKSGKHR